MGKWEERQRNFTIFLKKKMNHEITLPNQRIKNEIFKETSFIDRILFNCTEIIFNVSVSFRSI